MSGDTSEASTPPGESGPPSGTMSPDGRHWWNGNEWVPMKQPPKRTAWLGIASVIVLLVLGIAGFVMYQQDQAEQERRELIEDTQRRHCEQFGWCD